MSPKGGKSMKNYELMYIVDTAVSDEQRENIISKFKALVENNNGKIVSEEKMGVKKYAYPINFKTEGYYVLLNFEADATLPAIIKKQMLITDGIVRHMIVAK